MTSVIAYFADRFRYRFLAFFRHWYLDSLRALADFFNRLLQRLDRILALRVTLRHFFEPLYQDRTFLGYVFGFFFRSGRVVVASIVYLFIVAFAILIYLAWAMLPIWAAFKLFEELI